MQSPVEPSASAFLATTMSLAKAGPLNDEATRRPSSEALGAVLPGADTTSPALVMSGAGEEMHTPIGPPKKRVQSALISLAQLSSSADLLHRSRTQTTKSIAKGLSKNNLHGLDAIRPPMVQTTASAPKQGMVKYNSCSTLFLEETIVHADLCQMLKWYIEHYSQARASAQHD